MRIPGKDTDAALSVSRQSLRSIGKNPVTPVVLASLCGQLAVVVTGPLLVRMLGIEVRGELALTYVVVLFASQLGMLGVPSAVAYFVARDGIATRSLLSRDGKYYASLSCAVSLLTVGGLIAALKSGLRLGSPITEVCIIGLGVPIFMWMLALSAGLQGEHRFRQLAITRLIAPFCFLGAVSGMYFFHYSGDAALPLGLNMGSWGITGITCWRFLRPVDERDYRLDHRAPSEVSRPVLFRYGRRSLVASAMPVDGLSVDQLALGAFSTHRELGLYSIGYGFESLPVLVLIAVASVAGPQIASARDRGVQRRLVRKWIVVGAGAALTACLAVELTLRPILLFAFGQEAIDAVPLARVLVLAGFFLGVRRVGSVALQSLGYPGLSTLAESIGLVVLVAALVSLTPAAGGMGTTIALCSAGFVAVVTQLYLLRRTRLKEASASPLVQ